MTGNLFAQSCIALDLKSASSKQIFQEMAELAINCGAVDGEKIKVRDIVEAIMERERLGSTGIGSGVAIPHAHIEGLSEVRAVFARLQTPIEYDALDERPVDLVVLLLAPKHANADHLKALAQISRLLRREEMRERLRSAPDEQALFLLLNEDSEVSAA